MAKKLGASSCEVVISCSENWSRKNLRDRSKQHILTSGIVPDFCYLYSCSLRSETHEPAHSSLALFKFRNETVEVPNSAELEGLAATVTHKHGKRDVFNLGFGLSRCHINLLLASAPLVGFHLGRQSQSCRAPQALWRERPILCKANPYSY